MSLHAVAASAPGKVILAGEHAVVHGTRAIATVIDLRTTATVTELPPSSADVTVRFHTHRSVHAVTYGRDALRTAAAPYFAAQRSSAGASNTAAMPDPALLDSLRSALSAVPRQQSVQAAGAPQSALSSASPPLDSSCLVFVLLFACLYRSQRAVACDITSQLPMSAGLGSSASLCVALAAAFCALSQLRAETAAGGQTDSPKKTATLSVDAAVVNAWAYEGERVLHGTPSGVDNAAIVHGGCLLYRRGHPFTFLPSLPPLSWLIVDTRQPRDTKRLVAGVGQRLRDDPAAYRPVIDRIDAIAAQWQDAILSPPADPSTLAALVDDNQSQLAALGVSHPTIDSALAVAARHGLAGKLTGAGGGGCVLLLARDGREDWSEVERELEQLGFQALRGGIGGSGVEVHVVQGAGAGEEHSTSRL